MFSLARREYPTVSTFVAFDQYSNVNLSNRIGAEFVPLSDMGGLSSRSFYCLGYSWQGDSPANMSSLAARISASVSPASYSGRMALIRARAFAV